MSRGAERKHVAQQPVALNATVAKSRSGATVNHAGLLAVAATALSFAVSVTATSVLRGSRPVEVDGLVLVLTLGCLLLVCVRALKVNGQAYRTIVSMGQAAIAKDVTMGALLAAADDAALLGRAKARLNALNDSDDEDTRRAASAALAELEALGRRDPAEMP